LALGLRPVIDALESGVTSRWGSIEPALFALATAGSGAFALALGQDANFDQRNYHVYLGWSFLANRIDLDLAPGNLGGSYLNPLFHVFHYLGITSLPPRLFGFALGAIHGLNAYLVYRLARHVLSGIEWERALAAAAGVVAASGPCAVSLLATTFGDNLLSILVLAAFLLLVRVAEQPGRDKTVRLFMAGLMAGGAALLKLTFGTYALALLGAVLALGFRLRDGRVVLVFATGGLAGGLLGGGYWAFQLWQRFGNPVFPFMNNLFRSPHFIPVGLRDGRWAPRASTDVLTAPAEMALGLTERLQEVQFRDPRYLVLLLVAGMAVATTLFAGGRLRRFSPAAKVIVVGWIVAYVVWASVFHYYRYFAAGEFLAPVTILALLRLAGERRLALAWLATAVLVVGAARTGSWGRVRWRDEPLRVRVPLREPAAVLVDNSGVSFALPFFPPGSRFFGIEGNGVVFDRLTAREIERHQGPVLRLCRAGAPPASVERFGLKEGGRCESFPTGGWGRLSLCRLERLSQ
jgi:hypothetical protein